MASPPELDDQLREQDRFDFGFALVGVLGGGLRWMLSDRVLIRGDSQLTLWQIETPDGFQDTSLNLGAVPTSEWANNATFSIGISPDASFEQARKVILEAVKSVKGVAETPAPDATISGFSAIGSNIDVQFFAETGANSGAAAAEAKLKIREALLHEHIGVAPPSGMTLVRIK